MSIKPNLVNFQWDTKAYLVDLFEKQDVQLEMKTDQLALEFQKMDDEIEKLKEYEKAIKEKIKALEANKLKTSIECAEYFESMGITKLDGVCVSSITLNKPIKEETVIKKKFISILDKKGQEEFLIEQGMARYDEVEELKESKPSTLRINKKRA